MGYVHSYPSLELQNSLSYDMFQASSPLQVKYADGELERLGTQNASE